MNKGEDQEKLYKMSFKLDETDGLEFNYGFPTSTGILDFSISKKRFLIDIKRLETFFSGDFEWRTGPSIYGIRGSVKSSYKPLDKFKIRLSKKDHGVISTVSEIEAICICLAKVNEKKLKVQFLIGFF